MDFKEFNQKVEKPIWIAIKEVIMQPRNILSINDKIMDIGRVIGVYNDVYRDNVGQDIKIEELVEVLKYDK